jgi:acyl-CoA hydrolase
VNEPSTPRNVRQSLVEMTELVLPEDTNPHGSIFGGRVLALIDKCAAMCAIRHTRMDVVTVAMDSIDFRNAVRLGDILILKGRMNAAFGSSMEIEVDVHSEDPYSGDRRLTTQAFVTMVCIDPRGRPQPVPDLEFETDDERSRAEEALARRERRLARRV